MRSTTPVRRLRFGVFELAPEVPELLKNGRRVRLRPQSLTLLALLAARPGELVLRADIEAALWGGDTFVDFEQGVNHCIQQIREVLNDSAESPRFVETIPRRGYRFIAEVEIVGQPPPAPSPEQVAAAVAGSAPSAPRWRRLGVAAVLGAVVFGGGAFAAWTVRGPAPGAPPSLIVRPFSTQGSDARLGVGLADVISARLSSQRIAVQSGSERAITDGVDGGRIAGGTFALSGEVSQTGSEMVVSARLADVATGATTWSEQFRVHPDELFSVEDVVAERVVAALSLRRAAGEQARLRRRYTSNAAAYEAYLHGRAATLTYTPAGTREAIAAFQLALQRDPAYALARAGLAMACADMYLRFAPASEVDEWGTCAETAARTALEADPDLAEAHLARAAVARKREFDWAAAVTESQRALILNPNLDQAHFFAAAAYYHLGYMEEATIQMERGRQLRGQDVVEPVRIEALVALFSGNFAPARVRLEEVSRRSSQAIGDTYLALAYYYTGSIDRGKAMLELLAATPSASTAARAGAALAAVRAAQGDAAGARAALDRVLASPYRDHHVAYGLGTAYAQLADDRNAAHWLTTAADTGFPCVPWFERDPLLDSFRRTPLFATVLDRVKTQRDAAAARIAKP
jgi:DNA-binding winged helix-turn-helix (wHTH) protein/TolB-like protein